MADLALGGGVILPAPEDTIYIFDEAHRIGATALNHFSSQCRLKKYYELVRSSQEANSWKIGAFFADPRYPEASRKNR